MGLFSHKDKTTGKVQDEKLFFVVYALPANNVGRFREEFDAAFGQYQPSWFDRMLRWPQSAAVLIAVYATQRTES